VVEGNTLTVNGQYIPSVGPWAFQARNRARPASCSTPRMDTISRVSIH